MRHRGRGRVEMQSTYSPNTATLYDRARFAVLTVFGVVVRSLAHGKPTNIYMSRVAGPLGYGRKSTETTRTIAALTCKLPLGLGRKTTVMAVMRMRSRYNIIYSVHVHSNAASPPGKTQTAGTRST